MTTEAEVLYNSMDWFTDGETEEYDEDVARMCWEDTAFALKHIINATEFGVVLTGTVQTWKGYGTGGRYIRDWKEFRDSISGYEIVVLGKGRKLFFKLVHHDGTHDFEMRRVTEKGYNWIINNPYLDMRDYAEHVSGIKGYTKAMFDKNFANYI